MKTRIAKAASSRSPSSAIRPPTSRVAVKPARMNIRMSGEKALERAIAWRFAAR